MDTVVSRDYHAKRLAKELDIPYAEALRRVRQTREVVEQTAAEMAEAAGIPAELFRECTAATAAEMARIRANEEALGQQVADRAESMRPGWEAVMRLASSPESVVPDS